jgi:hypothetical protein
MSERARVTDGLPAWAGPALFTTVAVALAAFFWWFL